MRPWIALSAIVMLGCGHGGSNLPINGAAPTAAQLEDERPLADSRTTFAFRLKDEILKSERGKNVCFSPISMQLCLSTLLNGTAGDSVEPLRKVLGFGAVSLDQINAANKALADNLAGPNVSIADAIWLQRDIEVDDGFRRRLADSYSADFFAERKFDDQTLRDINAWVSDHTQNRVSRILDELSPQSGVVIVNATTFDARWQHEFDPKHTNLEAKRALRGEAAAHRAADLPDVGNCEGRPCEAPSECGSEATALTPVDASGWQG